MKGWIFEKINKIDKSLARLKKIDHLNLRQVKSEMKEETLYRMTQE